MRVVLISLLLCELLTQTVARRRWRDVPTRHTLSPQDERKVEASIEIDTSLLFTPSPTPGPTITAYPTSHPTATILPSSLPSIFLSSTPSMEPSMEPSTMPSRTPADPPTRGATPSPTKDLYPPNPVPSNPPQTYFNYDESLGTNYGPGYPQVERHNETHYKNVFQNNGWTKYVTADDSYWSEFDEDGFGAWKGVLTPRYPSRNRCWKVGKQSPIDVRPNGAKCYEGHQIRSMPGDYGIRNTNIEKLIESNKLRLKYARRPCAAYEEPECAEPDPPHADFPHNWGGFSDVTHIDFKIPSEHTIYGERFDGEMQIYHLHPTRRRLPTISVLMRATEDSHNPVLQSALDEFQKTYDKDKDECLQRIRRKNRKLVTNMTRTVEDELVVPFLDTTVTTATKEYNYSNTTERELQSGIWSPYNPMLVPSLYFFRYDGSLTEPPCAEIVSWFISDEPMRISLDQLEQMKTLLFTHISPTCEKTSVHWRNSVARPIQDTFGRPVWRCSQYNFQPDRP